MIRATMLARSLAFCAIAAFAIAMPYAKADPPKATLTLVNTTSHEVVIDFDSPSTKAWMKVMLAPGAERVVYEIVGPFKLVGVVKSNPVAALVPRDVSLSKTSYLRLRIELVDGRYTFVKP